MNPVNAYRRRKRTSSELLGLLLNPNMAYRKLVILRAIANSIWLEVSTLEDSLPDDTKGSFDLAAEVDTFERELIRTTLIKMGGNQAKTAEVLNIKPTTLYEKLKRFDLKDDIEVRRVAKLKVPKRKATRRPVVKNRVNKHA